MKSGSLGLKSKLKYLSIFTGGFSLVFVLSALYMGSGPKIKYVDNKRLFNEFILKKELEKEFKIIQTRKTSYLDSLRVRVALVGEQFKKDGNVAELDNLREQFFLKEQQIQEENQILGRKYDEQILKQLNEYVRQYGEANEIDILLGTSGEGNLMYSKQELDVTGKVIEFVNLKHSGKLK